MPSDSQSIFDRVMQQPLWLGILVLLFLPSVLPILMMSIPLVGAIVAVFYCLGPSATGKAPREGSPAQSSPSQPATGEAPKPSDGAICSSESPNLSAPSHTPHSTSFNILPTDASASPGHSAHAPLTGSAALLARMRADRSKPVPTTKNLVVLYASQTGTAQEIAKGIAAEAASSGLQAKAYSFNEFGFENLTASRAPVVVIVASSTGDGDPPENAAKFLVSIKRSSQPKDLLKGIQYTCLGLGDSNYTRFCAAPRAFASRFEALGAENFHPNKEVDEVDGLEEGVETWLESLRPALAAALKADKAGKAPEQPKKQAAPSPAADELVGVPALLACSTSLIWEEDENKVAAASTEASRPAAAELEYRDEHGLYGPEAPFWAPVTKCENLCAGWSDREVLHLEWDLSGSGMQCHPGDAMGVMPHNSEQLVEGIIGRLGADGSRVFSVAEADGSPARPGKLSHLRWPCTLRSALSTGCDLTGVPKKSLLRMLAEYCGDATEKHRLLFLCSRGGKDEYKSDIVAGQPSLLDLLSRFPSCAPPLPHLLEALPPLAPRLYSLTSSQMAHPDAAHVAFSVVRFTTPYGPHEGVATSWLKSSCLDTSRSLTSMRMAVFLRPNKSFRPPQDLSVPLVMIGPGTGVAPFRGFLQERRARAARGEVLGPSWLFFGCRRKDEDFLYRAEIEGFASDGTLTYLEAAFSREQEEKVYVQHRIRERGAELCADILHVGCSVMVCGDGGQMAKDVHQCLSEVLAEHGGMTAAQAAERLAQMTKQGRYVRDIWS